MPATNKNWSSLSWTEVVRKSTKPTPKAGDLWYVKASREFNEDHVTFYLIVECYPLTLLDWHLKIRMPGYHLTILWTQKNGAQLTDSSFWSLEDWEKFMEKKEL